ncbi:DUF3369 domain-containing protein [bacterium]|nr:DUF3369 domain-containing protein [candidate division CSSED10-310 bacterium]
MGMLNPQLSGCAGDIGHSDEIERRIKAPWKVIIADDEPEIHSVTRLVLDGFEFDHRRLQFISTYSGMDTCAVIRENPDTALLLLDVVMESEDAGLRVVRYIREELGNLFVRIVLRTGQPGQAPERQVISAYDINDYKEKTDLTAERLFTMVMSSLRTYRDLQLIDRNRRSLERIVETSPRILGYHSLGELAREILWQLGALLHIDNGYSVASENALFVIWDREIPFCLAGSGRFVDAGKKPLSDVLSPELQQRMLSALDQKAAFFSDRQYCGWFRSANGAQHAIYLECSRMLEQQDRELIRLFATTAAAAFETIHLNKEIEATQKEIIDTLGEMVECRFREMGNHVRRVSEYAQLLALKAGLSEKEAEILKFAAPMHDIGKIGIPDDILKKPGRLTFDEFEIMKRHTSIGFNILKRSERDILKAGSIIALQHHERWDGKGYPQGLKGNEIHVLGRITRLVDVFDALSNRRVYKDAWPLEQILEYIREESGAQFDPLLVDLFLVHIDAFLQIKDQYPDEAKQR